MLPAIPAESAREPLLHKAALLIRESLALQGGHVLPEALAESLRAMNSYYTNKIEGQHTLPLDIQRALHHQFAPDEKEARRQRIALVHMAAEQALESGEPLQSTGLPYAPADVQAIHAALYSRLPETERLTDEGERIVPGEWRNKDVAVGRHVPPPHADVPDLLQHWGGHYQRLAGTELQVIGAICAHHRLAWIHPFIDGNGRTARLHTHLVLHRLGLTQGLWSPMRGLARQQDEYYARLNNADLPRRNDLDGRGQLSQEELVKFADFFLDVCLDQVRYMREMTDMQRFGERLKELVLVLGARRWQVGSESSIMPPEVFEPLHYTALTGAIPRATFVQMTGLPERTARRALASLLKWGLLTSSSHRADVAFHVPMHALNNLFPRLWPEAADVQAPVTPP